MSLAAKARQSAKKTKKTLLVPLKNPSENKINRESANKKSIESRTKRGIFSLPIDIKIIT